MPHFDGETYEPDEDEARLSSQLKRVFTVMSDGREHTLAEVAVLVGGSEAAVSARLRDFRKERFGGFTIVRRRIDRGLFGYTLWLPPPNPPMVQATLFDPNAPTPIGNGYMGLPVVPAADESIPSEGLGGEAPDSDWTFDSASEECA